MIARLWSGLKRLAAEVWSSVREQLPDAIAGWILGRVFGAAALA